jgi:hypothetical protein
MILGKFGDEDELFCEIELITADRLEISVDALFYRNQREFVMW